MVPTKELTRLALGCEGTQPGRVLWLAVVVQGSPRRRVSQTAWADSQAACGSMEFLLCICIIVHARASMDFRREATTKGQ